MNHYHIRGIFMMQSLNSGDSRGSKSVVMKSPDLLEAKQVYIRCVGVQVLIWTINYMITLSIADIPKQKPPILEVANEG